MLRQPTFLSKGCLNNFPVVLVTRTFRIPLYSLPHTSIPIVFPARVCCLGRNPILRFSTIDDHNNPSKESSSDASFASTGGKEDHGEPKNSTTEILKRLKKYGMSGVLSYGLLNTAYYLPTFLFVWLYVAPAPGKMGYVAAVERFLKTFAMVWAGSQVTKIGRAAGALALAPVVDRGLSWFTETNNHHDNPEIQEPTLKIQKLVHENGSFHGAAAPFLRIKKLSEKAVVPSRASPLSAGYDLYSAAEMKVPARGKALIPTDLSIAVPEGTYARIAPRSGLAWKNSIDVGAGVIDSDYRGPVGVILFNHSDVDFEVKTGDRIAQLIIELIFTPEVEEVDDLDVTVRGSGGFGSTGV